MHSRPVLAALVLAMPLASPGEPGPARLYPCRHAGAAGAAHEGGRHPERQGV